LILNDSISLIPHYTQQCYGMLQKYAGKRSRGHEIIGNPLTSHVTELSVLSVANIQFHTCRRRRKYYSHI